MNDVSHSQWTKYSVMSDMYWKKSSQFAFLNGSVPYCKTAS